jgi:hypothetical protein
VSRPHVAPGGGRSNFRFRSVETRPATACGRKAVIRGVGAYLLRLAYLEKFAISVDQSRIAVSSHMGASEFATFAICVDLTFDPPSPLRVRQRDAFGVKETDTVPRAKLLNVEYPAISIRHI